MPAGLGDPEVPVQARVGTAAPGGGRDRLLLDILELVRRGWLGRRPASPRAGWGREHESVSPPALCCGSRGSAAALSGTLPVGKTQKCHFSLSENGNQVGRNSLACGLSRGMSLPHP